MAMKDIFAKFTRQDCTQGSNVTGTALTAEDKHLLDVNDPIAAEILADILIELGGGPSGTNVHEKGSVTSTPGSEQTIISFTVAALKTRKISRIRVTSRQRVQWRLVVGGTDEATGRTGPGELNDDFIYDPNFDATAGVLVELKAIQDSGPASDIEGYVMASEV